VAVSVESESRLGRGEGASGLSAFERRRRIRASALALLAAASLTVCRSSARFTPELPPGMPDLRTWEKSTGMAELDDPRRVVEYELYVGPERSGVYGVARYRIAITNPELRRASGLTANEKLQWDVDGRKVRRFECVPEPESRRQPCRWKEYPRGSPEYDAEMRPLLSIYALHAALLHRREAEQGREQ
jgi:hypothetical protein